MQSADDNTRILVFNGWAASPEAWSLSKHFNRFRIFDYLEQLDALPEEFLERSGRKFVFVGWSMGASSALRLATKYPRWVAGFVLIAPTPRMMEDKSCGWRGMSERRLDALRRGIEITHGEGFSVLPEGMPKPYRYDTDENLRRGLVYLHDTDIREDLRKIPQSVPMFIFHSERDGIVRSENAVYLKSVFPGANVRMVPGTEHALSIFIPEEIDEAIDTCLAIAEKSENS